MGKKGKKEVSGNGRFFSASASSSLDSLSPLVSLTNSEEGEVIAALFDSPHSSAPPQLLLCPLLKSVSRQKKKKKS